MKVKCPNCSHKFAVSQDDIYLDYDVDYDDSTKYVWEELPVLKSTFYVDTEKNQKETKQQ